MSIVDCVERRRISPFGNFICLDWRRESARRTQFACCRQLPQQTCMRDLTKCKSPLAVSLHTFQQLFRYISLFAFYHISYFNMNIEMKIVTCNSSVSAVQTTSSIELSCTRQNVSRREMEIAIFDIMRTRGGGGTGRA